MVGRTLKYNILLKIFNKYLYDSLLPLNLNYFYNFGSILGLFLILQIITGLFLTMYYTPHIEYAFDSVEYIMREVSLGYVIRYIHANGASLFFIALYAHIMRALLYGSYTKFRTYTWNIGVLIFLLMIITAFLGYSLPYGSMSYWAISVITNLLTVIPYFGHDIVSYIFGGYNVGNPTLNRFYTLHFLMPFIISAMTIIHIMTLHSVGGSNPLGINNIKTISLINFHPYYTTKDIFGYTYVIIILLYLSFFNPNLLSHPDNYIPANPLITPAHIVPEFYLLPFYCILRAIPNKILGVICLLFAILFLFFIPYLHNSILSTSLFRPIYKFFVIIFFFNFVLLMIGGQSLIEEPFITISIASSMFYFIFLSLIIPFVSFIETLMFSFLHRK